jgi:amino acid transporter
MYVTRENMQTVVQKNEPVEDRSLISEEYPVKAMPSILGTFDMTSTYLLIIFFITNATTAASGGAAAFTFLLLGGITYFIPSVIATAQLGTLYPYEGSLYNWTHKAFGGFWSFFSAFCAWFPGILVMISAGDVIVTLIQNLNSNWLTDPREQGAVIIAVIIFSGILATQRFRIVQNIVNVAAVLTFLAVFFIGLAGVVWLLQGHPSATNFADLTGWQLNWQPGTGNISLFGLITLAYLGAEGPLNMAGEIKERKVITKHLAWGTIFVFIGYFVATFTLLVVYGSAKASASAFSLVGVVDTVLGKAVGNLTVMCLMSFFLITTVVYGYTYARLPLVAALDQRLPILMGRLNKYRVPSGAIWVQVIFASVVTFLVFFAFPFVPNLGSPINLTTEVYNVLLAGSTLVWAFSTLFLFINVAIFYFRDRERFNRHRIFPGWLLAVTMPLGALSSILAIVDTLFNSWIGALIDNTHWLLSIGSVTLVCVLIAALGSMFASSEAAWESMSS